MAQASFAHVISSRKRDLGGFSVRRVLPTVGRKLVGPFIFFDHMGPAHFGPGEGMDVRPHPHIGLATVTFLFDGAIWHRDSLGSSQVIRPGDINWMTAGRGIVHSERTPPEVRNKGGFVEGIQLWVALPRSKEEMEPSFVHHPESSLPRFTQAGVTFTLLIGYIFDAESPVKSESDSLYADLQMEAGSSILIPAGKRELAVYAAQGAMRVNDSQELMQAGSMVVGRVAQDLRIEASGGKARVMLIGGEPLPETRKVWWNFVSSSNERIEAAKLDWASGKFPKVPGDEEEFIPLPEEAARPQLEGTVL